MRKESRGEVITSLLEDLYVLHFGRNTVGLKAIMDARQKAHRAPGDILRGVETHHRSHASREPGCVVLLNSCARPKLSSSSATGTMASCQHF